MPFKHDIVKKLLAFTIVFTVLFSMSASMALAEEHGASEKGTITAQPDITVIMGATGDKIGGANVYIDDTLVGKTDSRGNFTFKEKPASGNHTVSIIKKGIRNVSVNTNFSGTPTVIKVAQDYPGKNVTILITDKNTREAIPGASVYNYQGDFIIGTTDDKGSISLKDFPAGLYLIKLKKEEYKDSTTLLIVASDRTQSYTLTPAAK